MTADENDPEFRRRAEEARKALRLWQEAQSRDPHVQKPAQSSQPAPPDLFAREREEIDSVAKAKELDKRLWRAAAYQLTEGNVRLVTQEQVQVLYRELKMRLKAGSWKSVSHVEVEIYRAFGPKEQGK